MSNVLAAFSERKGASHARAVKAAAAGAVLHDAEVEEIKQEEEIRNRKLTFAQKKMRRVMVVRKLSATTTNLAFVAGAGQGSIFSPGGVDGEVTSNPMNVFLRRFQRRARVGLEALVVIPRDRTDTEQRRAFHFLEKHPPMKQFWKRFAVPSAAERHAFTNRAHIYQYLKARKKLFAEGMPDLFVFVVLFGQVGLIVQNHDGTSQQVAYKAGPGAILGAENCVFEMLCAQTATAPTTVPRDQHPSGVDQPGEATAATAAPAAAPGLAPGGVPRGDRGGTRRDRAAGQHVRALGGVARGWHDFTANR